MLTLLPTPQEPLDTLPLAMEIEGMLALKDRNLHRLESFVAIIVALIMGLAVAMTFLYRPT